MLARPINRLVQQFVRNNHLTFKKKCRDLVIQIFGHEALVEKMDMAGIAHCNVFNEDVYRLSAIHWRLLAKRKLFNPFKWAEFLIVAPLELLSWSIVAPIGILGEICRAHKQLLAKWPGTFAISWIIAGVILLCYPAVHLAVNLVTGVLRRFLAPVRYLIRPAFETARKYPRSFALIVAIPLMLAVGVTGMMITGGLPAILGSFLLTGTWAAKLMGVGLMSVTLGAVLTQAFNTVRDLIDGVWSAINAPSKKQQELNLGALNALGSFDDKITEVLHAIDIEHVNVVESEQQGVGYTMALFTGTESLFFSKKPHAVEPVKPEEFKPNDSQLAPQ